MYQTSSHITLKEYTLDVLNGSSLGIVVTLIPAALTSQLLKLFPAGPLVSQITMMVTVAQSLLAAVAAVVVGHMLKLKIMDSACIALATFVSSGAIVTLPKNAGYALAGTGSILNIMLTLFITTGLVLLLKDHLGQLKIVLAPTLVLLIGGGIGLLTLKPMVAVQSAVGRVVAAATHLTPILMGIALAVLFAILILSPLSTVGIATAISLAGVGSGAANAGIVVASFTLAWMGASVNPLGGTLAHFLGSPKIQMANMLRKPQLFIPIIIGAAITGATTAALNLNGTPFSAGFGFSGLIGPLTAWQESAGDLVALRVLVAFVIVPVVLAGLLNLIFVKKLHLVHPDDLKLPD